MQGKLKLHVQKRFAGTLSGWVAIEPHRLHTVDTPDDVIQSWVKQVQMTGIAVQIIREYPLIGTSDNPPEARYTDREET